jgi:hypothetical protein
MVVEKRWEIEDRRLRIRDGRCGVFFDLLSPICYPLSLRLRIVFRDGGCVVEMKAARLL